MRLRRHDGTIISITNAPQHAGEQPAAADTTHYCVHAHATRRALLIYFLN